MGRVTCGGQRVDEWPRRRLYSYRCLAHASQQVGLWGSLLANPTSELWLSIHLGQHSCHPGTRHLWLLCALMPPVAVCDGEAVSVSANVMPRVQYSSVNTSRRILADCACGPRNRKIDGKILFRLVGEVSHTTDQNHSHGADSRTPKTARTGRSQEHRR